MLHRGSGRGLRGFSRWPRVGPAQQVILRPDHEGYDGWAFPYEGLAAL
jgi:hypothetical protein